MARLQIEPDGAGKIRLDTVVLPEDFDYRSGSEKSALNHFVSFNVDM